MEMRSTVDGATLMNRPAITHTPGRPGTASAARMAAAFAAGEDGQGACPHRARQPGTNPFLDHRALELGKHGQHPLSTSAGCAAGPGRHVIGQPRIRLTAPCATLRAPSAVTGILAGDKPWRGGPGSKDEQEA